MMIIRFKQSGYLLAISSVVWIFANIGDNAFGQEIEEHLKWDIKTSKKEFYPGEPMLLTLKTINTGNQEEKVDFGADGIEAFSIEVRDNFNKIVAKGGKIERFGFSTTGPLELPPGKIGQKSIVLNQWCPTLLPPSQYHVACHVEYRLRSEATKIPGTEHGFKAGPLHTIELGLDVNIIKMDTSEFKKIIEQLSGQAFKTNLETKEDLVNRRIARDACFCRIGMGCTVSVTGSKE